jgi:3-isopropylmalate dehydrogenase
MVHRIAVLPGDGIGQEIVREAVKVLEKVSDVYGTKFEFKEALVGYEAYRHEKTSLPEETVKVCKESDSVLFGAVGHPEAEKLPPEEQPERAALLPLRKMFDLYANLRHVKVFRPLAKASPLRPELIKEGLDIMIVRELTSGIYFGKKQREESWAADELKYTKAEIERIAKLAFELAMKRGKRLTSIDKANVLSSMVLWREVVSGMAKDFAEVEVNHLYVDNAAMQLVRWPKQFDVMLAGNMFGDILSDEASMIAGSIGMLPSASINEGRFGLYEPIHGSAPDIMGQDKANPCAQILSAAMMLRYSFGLDKEAAAIEKAIEKVLEEGYRTADIMEEGRKPAGTEKMGSLIASRLE